MIDSSAPQLPIEEMVPAACAQIRDYPNPGILFYDVTTLFANAEAFRRCIDELADRFEGTFDIVAGVEARGFLMASAIAYKAGTGVMTVRKAGKLPRDTYMREYQLEYGSAAIEIHKDDFEPGTRVLIVDDLLATGGTLAAAVHLMHQASLEVAGVGVFLELEGMGGREAIDAAHIESLAVVSENQ
ncbi:MAG: adenine phosphoribosyltransferase [Rothia sp. (in: high G+C Gram-positive bacteria)]|nr:adenine phosphoribosyltransferase [Rothia sp. (in: high G+C Gram-positive bacteria)]